MDFTDIKGILEINGKKYDPNEVIQALIEQGVKIHTVNDSLLVGRKFIDPSSNLAPPSVSCPIVSHCKIFDQLKYSEKSDEQEELNSAFLSYSSSGTDFNTDRNYIEDVQVNNDDFDIHPLFSSQDSFETFDSSVEPFEYSRATDFSNSSDKSTMVGISPVTKYGNPSQINLSKIPVSKRGICIHCGSVINKQWKHCAKCGGLTN